MDNEKQENLVLPTKKDLLRSIRLARREVMNDLIDNIKKIVTKGVLESAEEIQKGNRDIEQCHPLYETQVVIEVLVSSKEYDYVRETLCRLANNKGYAFEMNLLDKTTEEFKKVEAETIKDWKKVIAQISID